MKTLRLAFLAALVVSSLVAPQAFGSAQRRSALTHPRTGNNRLLLADDDFIITCPNGKTATCTGSVDDCLFLCDFFCNTPSGTCQYINN
jgi:hypothetical protein